MAFFKQELATKELSEPIALVGVGCRLPGGVSSEADLLAALRNGRECVVEVPRNRWNSDADYDPDPVKPGKTCVKHGGFVDDLDRFDAAFFHIAREQVTKAPFDMAACDKTVTTTNTGALTAIVFAAVLAAGFAGPAAAAECPGAPVPYGLIGNTWSVQKYRLGCPVEPEHDVPGRKGRLQTFQNGQIAWVPDQGPSMTIWAIRTKAHFRVEWNTNDNWDYDKYLIRWDRNGQNLGQRDISGTTTGWWDFDFNTPGTYTFIVEGRSGGGYHHGWTIPVGGTISPGDIPPPPPPPRPPPPPPTINANTGGAGAQTILTVTGSNFLPQKTITVRVVDDVFHERNFQQSSTTTGGLNMRISLACNSGLPFHVSATDSRPAPGILGVLFSNYVTLPCP